MPELLEQMYCSQQIVIPPKFPYILKRFCKAAIKTQPYDLLRWSFEYFRCLSLHRPPPVKLRLEYPVYSTEGGLTRGCLKVLAQQLAGMSELPMATVKAAWQGFCLDPQELNRILCLCEVYLREESVPYLHFIAVAGGLLTKSLTNTMILLCETLTKEPDGGSAAIPVKVFLTMYKILAKMDAAENVRYLNGYREGSMPTPESSREEEEAEESVYTPSEDSVDDFWTQGDDLQKLTVTNDHVARTARLSVRLNLPVIGHIRRSPSVERAAQIERENYMKDSKGKPLTNEEIENKLREMSSQKVIAPEEQKEKATKTDDKTDQGTQIVHIIVTDEDGEEVPYEIYGEPKDEKDTASDLESYQTSIVGTDAVKPEEDTAVSEAAKIQTVVNILLQRQRDRQDNLQETFDELAAIVDKFHTANYDLGMIAGRQMSTTSGEFIVQHIEKEIMAYIDEQIAILPDPDLKKKKAKPEEVAMIRSMLEDFIDDNMSVICPEIIEEEEEEAPIPEITLVYAVPGIGAPVDADIVHDFEEYALDVCKVQADMFMPRNIRHFMCPPLEKYTDPKYDETLNKYEEEEVATAGGTITE